MALPTISVGDLLNKGTTGMPANPELSVADLQAKFDELSLDVIVPKFQALVTALENASAGADLGVTAPTGITASNKVKSVLDAMAVILLALKDKSDGDYDDLVTLFTGITAVSNVVDGLSTTIPTAKAITDFIQSIGGGDMLRTVYDTDLDGIVDNSEKLGNQLPAYYATASSVSTINGTLATATGNIATLLAKEVVYDITVATTDWVATTGGYYAIKTLSGATSTTNADWCMKIAGSIPTDTEESNNNLVKNVAFGTNTITFYSKSLKPTATMEFRIKGV